MGTYDDLDPTQPNPTVHFRFNIHVINVELILYSYTDLIILWISILDRTERTEGEVPRSSTSRRSRLGVELDLTVALHSFQW